VFALFPLPAARSYPLGITPGRDGALWFTEELGNRIGRITIAGRSVSFPSPHLAMARSHHARAGWRALVHGVQRQQDRAPNPAL